MNGQTQQEPIIIDEIQKVPALLDEVVVSLDTTTRKTEDAVEIVPLHEFLNQLWSNSLIT